jgi:hypothetical protein
MQTRASKFRDRGVSVFVVIFFPASQSICPSVSSLALAVSDLRAKTRIVEITSCDPHDSIEKTDRFLFIARKKLNRTVSFTPMN